MESSGEEELGGYDEDDDTMAAAAVLLIILIIGSLPDNDMDCIKMISMKRLRRDTSCRKCDQDFARSV